MSRESGYYPPGAEFDPRDPWNQKDCDNCGDTGKDEDGDDCVECQEGGECKAHHQTYPCPDCAEE